MHWPQMGTFSWIGWFASCLVFLILVGALVAFVVYYTRASVRNQAADMPGGGGQAVEILKERYARGEITREEFREMRRELEGDVGTGQKEKAPG